MIALAAALAAALALEPASGAAPGAASPALLESLRAETARAKEGLRTEGFEKPYHLNAGVFERSVAMLESAGGALLPLRQARQRFLRVSVRVGSHDLDNSGYLDPGSRRGSGTVSLPFPLDDDAVAMRRMLWLAYDEAYKQAGATLAAKKAFLATQGPRSPDGLGDFTAEAARKVTSPAASLAADRARLEPFVRRLSAALAGKDAPLSRLRVWLFERSLTLVESDGTEIATSSTFVGLEAVVWGEAPDGEPVQDQLLRYGRTLDGLGAPEALEAELRGLVVSFRAAEASPRLEETYHGPVLFESDASAQLFLAFLGGRIDEPRVPVSASSSGGGGEWSARLGGRVVSPLLTVRDDPTLTAWKEEELLGGYAVDLEGMPGKPVTLISNGVLKDFLGSRWPRKGAPSSNGHARTAGGPAWKLGLGTAPSNLIVTAGEGSVSLQTARARLLEEVGSRGLPFGLVARKLNDSSLLKLGATDLVEAGEYHGRLAGESELEVPLVLYKVTPDGKETRLRGACFGTVSADSLKSSLLAVTAPSEPESVLDTILTFDFGYPTGGPVTSSFLPVSVVAPGGVLLEDVELRSIRGPFPRKPIAAARTQPPASASRK